MKRNNILINILFIITVIGVILAINTMINKNKLTFTSEDYNYMYNDIEKTFGNGEKFHVEKTTEKYIDNTLISVAGKQATITGYFDSQDNMYVVVYGKYLKDRPAYKNGKAGNVLFLAVNTGLSKEEYFNNKESK